ncbi:DUF4876 domain-containing protein [Coprobacter tertius]|uniref:DUF4876 domain-containing protein n=1 Tax=Coprobacter tertius TaxID=2944915 RepID=A0ABT1MDV1_9BACT|nr:DUF4876 domain-containing protein [Coprobacter tertius]MCP9610529.1 DUF4876 domain-containing protein [Coprobacter tertius]
MRKSIISILTLLAVVLVVSCSDDDNKAAVKYKLTVTVNLPSDINAADVTDLKVTVKNQSTQEELIADVANNKAEFTLAGGEYNIMASGSAGKFAINGSKDQVGVYADTNISIDMVSAVSSGLIIKEVYYSGAPLPPYYVTDQFIEIYNNSDKVQYLDNVMIGVVMYMNSKTAVANQPSLWVDGQGNLLDRYPIYNYLMAFPGTGQSYPLEPGKSVVVAQNAVNHHAQNPNSPVDLSNADWETFVPGKGDTDNENVKNLDVIYGNGLAQKDFAMGLFINPLIIAKLPEGTTPADFAADESNFMAEPTTGRSDLYIMIPSKYVLDAIDIVDGSDAVNYKHILNVDDAGIVKTPGSFTGKSIRRKVVSIENGRVKYKDTNNSSVDFLIDQTPTPGVQPTTVDE